MAGDDATYLGWLCDRFVEAEDASDKSRTGAQLYVDYYDGKQLTEEEKREMGKRGQPPVIWNRVREKIDYLQGTERTQRTKPRALPRTPVHEQDSAAATDALQYVYDDQRYDETRSRIWGDILKAGWGGAEVTVEARAQRQDELMGSTSLTPSGPKAVIRIRRCQWDRMFWDPFSSEDDYSDTADLGIVIWMDRDEAVRQFGEQASAVFDETITIGASGGTYDDKPQNASWVSGTGARRRIRVIQMYYIGDDGGWDLAYFTKGGILYSSPSPWIDENGEREHPYCWRSAYVDRDNNRYGSIRDMVDLQDEINKRRSKSLHTYTSRQTFGNQKYSANANENKKQLARPDGHVKLIGEAEFGKDFGIIPTNDQAQGHMELLAQAVSAFETVGPNAAMQGKKGATESGRAILAQQQGGSIQTSVQSDGLRQMDMQVYRKVWNRIRQFWTDQMWVRVTDDERNVRFVGLNGAITTDPKTGQQTPGPNIAQLDVDIIIDEAPAAGTLLDEQWQGLVGLAQAGVTFPPEVYIKSMPNLRNKDQLLRITEEQKQQPPDPMAVRGAQAEIADKEASAKQRESAAVKNIADAEATMAGIQIDIAQAMQPQPVATPQY